jgi:hypothetical protein
VPERDLERVLRDAARALDVEAPSFDVGLLDARPQRRSRVAVVALACAAALALAAAAAPAAISALRSLFEVDEVTALGELEPGVAPSFPGRPVTLDVARAQAPFHLRTVESLGAPSGARVRDDVAGGMVTIVYRGGGTLLTQWRTDDVQARVAIVPASGTAEDVSIGAREGLWVEGTARGTFTLVGADRTTHRESFEVGPGALLWMQDGMTFLLQGAGSRLEALRLAAELGG